jgi:hypothetical protein
MAFKPKNSNITRNDNFEPRNYPVPKAGSRKARVSLIVDLGTQEREDFEDEKTGEVKPQKPCHQVAVFADLVADKVDYGGDIGEQHYRLCLNKTFSGELVGVNFTATPPKDNKGNTIAGKPWGFHPQNLLTKLAKAVGKPEVVETMDIEELLDMPFMATVEVKEKDSEKEDKDGNPIIYRNVNYKGASEVPEVEDDDGNSKPMAVAKLAQKARLVTFDNATVEDIKFLRQNIRNKIKLAKDYAGSNIEKAIQEFEAEQASKPADEPKEQDKPKTASSKKTKPPVEDIDESESPF